MTTRNRTIHKLMEKKLRRPWNLKYWDNKSLLTISNFIIHLFIFVDDRVVLVQRNEKPKSKIWWPLSETFEAFADLSLKHTAKRGIWEELGLGISLEGIKSTGFRFRSVSPKGNPIRGETFYTYLAPSIISTIKLNAELSDYRLFGVDEAIGMMGYPEAVDGLENILKKTCQI